MTTELSYAKAMLILTKKYRFRLSPRMPLECAVRVLGAFLIESYLQGRYSIYSGKNKEKQSNEKQSEKQQH